MDSEWLIGYVCDDVSGPFLEDTPEMLTMLAHRFTQESDETVFLDGVSFCQAVLKTWMHDVRADLESSKRREPLESTSENQVVHYCQFRKSVSNKRRSCWRWYEGVGWRQVPVSAIDFGSRYVVASMANEVDGGDKSGDRVVEFHVCDERDCTKLASSLKCMVERCAEKKCAEASTTLDETLKRCSPTSGLVQLIKAKERPASSIAQRVLDEGCDPPPHCFVDDSDNSETSAETAGDGPLSSGRKEAVSESASSATSRSGFFSHYAYERTCDMLISATSSKQLPSVVVDETEQLRSQHAGRVRQLIRMYNGLPRK